MSGEQDLVGAVILGHYRIVRPIAWGGMGVIYLARNEGAEGFVRPVVVKRILDTRSGDEHFVRMFVREARILAQLRHPGIVGILDFARERDGYFMVLEYVHGYSLRHWARYIAQQRGPFPADLALEVIAAVADALHYAHTLVDANAEPLHVVHRDVSPANVLIDVEGHVKLADFGIARAELDRTDGAPRIEVKGKIAYLAPELLRLGEPSPASDVYSLGVVLHEILVGKNEHHQGDAASTAVHVLGTPLSPVHETRTELPASLSAVIARATAPTPGDRYGSAQELAQALRAEKEKLPSSGALSDATTRDFFDPQLASLTGATELDDLAHAWQDAGAGPAPLREPTGEQTIAGPPPTFVAVPPPPPRAAWWMRAAPVLGATALVVAAAAVAVVLTRSPPERPAPQFVLIEGEARPYEDDAPAPSKGHETPPPRAPADPAPDAGTTPAKARAPSEADALGRTFASRRGQVARCVEANGGGIDEAPEVVIRFQIAADGAVTSAELSPASLGGTPIGACVLQVARATRFPPQREPISFRIPVSFRRRR